MEKPAVINHVAIVADASASMQPHARNVVTVTDEEVKYLASQSQVMDQETRVTFYTFNATGRYSASANVQCVYYDKDALRIPTISGKYSTDGMTPLIDATMKAVFDLQQTATLYGDHAFLLWIITDGQENASRSTAPMLKSTLDKLPDNWTIATLVPDQVATQYAIRFGFPVNNIATWDSTSTHGFVDVGQRIRRATDTFMQARATGTFRGSKSIFDLDVSKLDPATVRQNLQQLDPNKYIVLNISKEGWQIRDFVENTTGKPYYTGSAFYQMTKPETIQAYKKVAIRDRSNGRIYSSSEARTLLGLPDYEVRVRPLDHPKFDIFVQSTSVNRKLVPHTSLLVMQ